MKKKDSKYKKSITKRNDITPHIKSNESPNTEEKQNNYPNDIQGLFERLGIE